MGDGAPGTALEQLHGQVVGNPVATGCIVELPRASLGVGDKFPRRVVGCCRVGHQHNAYAGNVRNGSEVLGPVWPLVVEQGGNRLGRGAANQQAVAVSGQLQHALAGDHPAGAGLVVNHKLLSELGRQALGQHPRKHIGSATSRKAHHDLHRLAWVIGSALGLRHCSRQLQPSAHATDGGADQPATHAGQGRLALWRKEIWVWLIHGGACSVGRVESQIMRLAQSVHGDLRGRDAWAGFGLHPVGP